MEDLRETDRAMENSPAVVRRPLPPVPPSSAAYETQQAAAQYFVSRMRAGTAGFAAAAGASSGVVPEVVPPARHRRSRCRLVLRYPGGAQSDTTFLGPAGPPTVAAREWFEGEICRWLVAGQRRQARWLVADPVAPGMAVDICAWAGDASAADACGPPSPEGDAATS